MDNEGGEPDARCRFCERGVPFDLKTSAGPLPRAGASGTVRWLTWLGIRAQEELR